MRLHSATLVAALLALTPAIHAVDQKAPAKKVATPKTTRELAAEKIVADYRDANEEAAKAFFEAKTDAERKAAEAKQPKEADFLPRILALVEKDPKDDVAAETLSFAVLGMGSADPKVRDLLVKHVVPTPKIGGFLQHAFGGAPDAATPVLERVLFDNPDKTLKGLACMALGNSAFQKSDDKAARAVAEKYFRRVVAEFAAVKVDRGDRGEVELGGMARGNLFEMEHLNVGQPAPAATSKDLKGNKTSLADLKGKVVVLDIWATWCSPCREMIPQERELVGKLKDKPFALVSVSVDDEKKDLEEFLEQEKMPWTHWWEGPDAPLVQQWNVRYYPTIYVIDAKGVIRFKNVEGDALKKAVAELLAEVK